MKIVNMHIQETGVDAGSWVICNAKYVCRNGGLHVGAQTLKLVQNALKTEGVKRTLKTISSEEIFAFLENNTSTKLFTQTSNPPSVQELEDIILPVELYEEIKKLGDKNSIEIACESLEYVQPKNGRPPYYVCKHLKFVGNPEVVTRLINETRIRNNKKYFVSTIRCSMTEEKYEELQRKAKQNHIKIYHSQPTKAKEFGFFGKEILALNDLELQGNCIDVRKLQDWLKN